MSKSLKNISLKDFRRFLEYHGLKVIRTKGGHEIWGGTQLLRPITLQSHITPVPEFIIRNNLRTMDCTKEDLIKFLEKKKH